MDIAFEHLQQIFSDVEREKPVLLPNGSKARIDLSARSESGRLLIFEIKRTSPGVRLAKSAYYQLSVLKESISKLKAPEPPVMILLVAGNVDNIMRRILTESGIVVATLGHTAEKTRQNLQEAFLHLSIALPEFTAHESRRRSTIGTCFVTMPFGLEYRNVYESAIKPAVADCGLEILSPAQLHQAGEVTKSITQIIRQADVVISDLTETNSNVLIETGMAQASEAKLIIISQNNTELPFDISRNRYILYERTNEGIDYLRSRLIEALEPYRQQSILANTIQPWMVSTLDEDEISRLCFLLIPTMDDSSRTEISKALKVKTLLQYCKKANCLDRLISLLQSMRPAEYTHLIERINSRSD